MEPSRALHKAAEEGDIETALGLLRNDPYLVASREDYKLTPLHRAALAGHTALVRALLQRSAEVDARNYGGGTPLHMAADRGREAVGAALLDAGADPDAQDLEGLTPLHEAARGGHAAMTALLLKRGADPNILGKHSGAPLHEAAERGHAKVVKSLLTGGALANLRSAGSATPFTPWHAARKAGHTGIAEVLRDHGGPDKAAQAVSVHRCAEAGYFGRLKLLVEADPALVASRDYLHKRTPLHWAAEGGHADAAAFLLGHGADLEALDKAGDTPLARALATGHAEVADLLRRRGA